MAADTLFVTGPENQQLGPTQIFVTPTGGTQISLADALASTAGSGPIAATTLTASSTVGLNPANHAVTISPTGSGTVTISPASAGSLNNVVLGNITPLAATVTSLIANDFTAGDSSLDVIGLGAAQGGSITLTGGASSASANAGGAVALVGGPPGATGVGGAVSLTGAAATSGTGGAGSLVGGAGGGAGVGGVVSVTGGLGGATNAVGGAAAVTAGAGQGTAAGAVASVTGGASGGGATGNGGLARIVGGAAASTDGTGGAAQVTGGAGHGSGAGGAVTVTSGAAGATGVAGAISVTVGGATAGNGSAITFTGGAGAGGTASGGNVNLVGGAAVSTGQPGEVQANGDSNLIFATYFFTGTPAATDQVFFVATRAMRVKTMSEVHSVAAGGTSTLTVIKDTGTSAPGAGTSLHQSGSFNLNATANTVQNGSVSTTIATANLAAGDRLSVKFANAIQASVGIVVTVGLVPI